MSDGSQHVGRWPYGDTTMAGHVRAHDWAATSLGRADEWPAELRCVVDMMLASPQVASLVVGPERVFLYNDAAAPLYGEWHPKALGRPLPELWPEAWAAVRHHYDRTFEGESVHVPAQPLDLERPGAGQVFEAYMTPVRDAGGRVIAANMTGFEVGARLRAEAALAAGARRQALLLQLSDAIRTISAPAEIQRTAMRLLGEHLELSRAYYFGIEAENGGWVHVIDEIWAREPGGPDIAGRHALETFGAWLFEDLERGVVAQVPDVTALARLTPEQRAGFEALRINAFVNVPLLRDGVYGAGIAAHHDHPHAWTDDEIGLIRNVAARTWMAVELARAAADLRASEENYHALLAASPVPFMVMAPNAPDFTITGANDAYLAATLTTREGLFGRSIFDVLTDDPARSGQLGSEGLRVSLERVLASGRPDSMPRTRYDIGRPDGGFEPRWWCAIHAPVLDVAGQITAIIHQVTDVTELHHAQVSEAQHQARQAFILAFSDALRPLVDPAEIQAVSGRILGEYLGADRACYVILDAGRQAATVAQEYRRGDIPTLVGEHGLAAFGTVMEAMRAGEVVASDDVEADPRFGRRDLRTYRAINLRSFVNSPLVKDGELVAAMCVVGASPRQWTQAEIALVEEVAERTWSAMERARAEAASRASEERLALAFRTLPLGIAIVDAAGDTITANDEMRRFLPTGTIPSRDPERIPRWHGWNAAGERVRPGDFPGARALRGEMVSPGMQMLYRNDDGTECWTEVLAAPLRDGNGPVNGAIIVVLDVDRVKRSEEAAQLSEERLRQFGEASQDILWVRDATTLQWEYLTPAFDRIYGLSRAEALTGDNWRNWEDLIDDEDRERAVASILKVRNGEQVNFEYRIRRPIDGEIRWLRNTDFPIRDDAGHVVRVGGVGSDITRMKEIEAEVAATQERLRVLMEGIPQLVWRSCDKGLWTWSSPQWQEFTGQSQAESQGLGWLDVIHPDDRDATTEAWEIARPHGRLDVEYRVRRAADGAWIWHHTRSAPVCDDRGRIVEWLGTSTDVHALRGLQERQGVKVAELQHRTRNLITVVRSLSDRTVGNAASLDDFKGRFGHRLAALSRVQGLLSHLTAGARVDFDELLRSELTALAWWTGKRGASRSTAPPTCRSAPRPFRRSRSRCTSLRPIP